MTDSARSGMV